MFDQDIPPLEESVEMLHAMAQWEVTDDCFSVCGGDAGVSVPHAEDCPDGPKRAQAERQAMLHHLRQQTTMYWQGLPPAQMVASQAAPIDQVAPHTRFWVELEKEPEGEWSVRIRDRNLDAIVGYREFFFKWRAKRFARQRIREYVRAERRPTRGEADYYGEDGRKAKWPTSSDHLHESNEPISKRRR